MKTVVISIFLWIISLSAITAQNRSYPVNSNSSMTEFKRHFQENILLLDPIEGIYDIEITTYSFNSLGIYQTQSTHGEVTIYKMNNQYYLRMSDKWKISFANIGHTNAYNALIDFYQVGEKQTKRIILQNNLSFNLEYTIPHAQAQIEFQNRNTLAGLKFSHSFIKTYPSQEQIELAQQAQIEKKAREQEMQQQALQKSAPSSGSGFLLAANGYIATNYHVIENANSIEITGLNQDFNTHYNAEIVTTDPNNDIAILRICDSTYKNMPIPPYTLQNKILELGQPCYTLGYPLITTMGVDIKLTNGIISSKTGFQGDVAYYQISVPVQPGNSGGPLFDKNGNVIGIVSAKHTDAENVGYAVKSSYLYNLIETLPTPLSLPHNTTLINKSLSEQVKTLRNYVCLILTNFNTRNLPSPQSPVIANQDPDYQEYPKEADIKPQDRVKIINNPVYTTTKKNRTCRITKIVISEQNTRVEFEFTNNYSAWYTIDPSAYMINGDTGEKLSLIGVENIALTPQKSYFSSPVETVYFTLIFSKIPQNTSQITIIENDKSPWRFYGIRLPQ